MNDNKLTDLYKQTLRTLENKGLTGTSFVLRALLPIVKVPTNYVAETAAYAAGGIKAAKIALTKGAKNLTPGESDVVMRLLKKQAVGAAILALGYFNADNFGGYYSSDDRKRDEKDVKPGGIRLFGADIPKALSHIPLLEVMQIGATLRRATDNKYTKQQSIAKGAFNATKGLLNQVPFVDEPMRLSRALYNTTSFSDFAGETAKGVIVPPDVENLAKMTDNGGQTKRYPQNLLQHITQALPGLRQTVPTKKKSTKIKL